MKLIFLFVFIFSFQEIAIAQTTKKQRKIVIVRDIRPQKMFCYEGDSLIAEFLVSTGRKGFETSLGKYQILTKRAYAWSKKKNRI